jgi:hypothetical protein
MAVQCVLSWEYAGHIPAHHTGGGGFFMNRSIIPIMRFSKFHHPSTFVRWAQNEFVGWAQNAVRRVAHQGQVQTLSLCLLIGMMGMAGLAWGQTAENYPKPVSESVEQTGHGKMTFPF